MQYTVEELHDGARFSLPRRNHEKSRIVGSTMIALGALFLALTLWLAIPGAKVVVGLAPGAWTLGLIRVAAALITFRIARVLLKYGPLILRGWSQVELSAGRIRAIERGGLRPWVQSRPLDALRSIEVTDAVCKGTGEGMAARPARGDNPERSALVARFTAGVEPLTLAPAYPRDVLLALAHEINDRLTAATPDPLFDADERSIAISVAPPTSASLDASPKPPEQLPHAPRPQDTDIQIAHSSDGLTITIPAAGVRAGAKGLFSLAIFWLVITIASTVAAFFSKTSNMNWVGWLALAAFNGAGVIMLLSAVNMGVRVTIIDVAHDALLISRRGVRGGRSWTRPRSEIESIRVGHSGAEINKQPILELQVRWLKQPKRAGEALSSRKLGLLAERREAELLWIAAELRAALAIGAGREPKSEAIRRRLSAAEQERRFAGQSRVLSERHEDRAA